MTTRVAVLTFPGTNCEFDTVKALNRIGCDADLVWHDARQLNGYDVLVIPGGFSYGDYLRPGAIARFSPVMQAVEEFASAGGPVIGICNGFQVLTEAHLLPGALQKNISLRFVCRTVRVRVETVRSSLTRMASKGQVLSIPINHFEGNFTCDDATLEILEEEERVVLRYENNPNGSVNDIAGICNPTGNVVGIMPHPERASDEMLGSTDGLVLLESLCSVSR
ncbi:MAG: phosphoribosylformylglycinamidine synthase subunit PurQ [Actinobacteria bacterium]|nr:phosphoribosylformylglycinamidine synthase subunit PurQ [Actinomycetota bacterium]